MVLTVLSVAYPLAPVGPDAVGGAEQVLAALDAALVEAGHRSRVIACEGSVTQGQLIAMPGVRQALDHSVRRRVQEQYREAIARVLRHEIIDLVHMHGIDFDRYLPPPGVPVLATLHLPPSWYPPAVFQVQRPHTYLHCVSHAQRRLCPPGARLLPVLENGVVMPEGVTSARKRRFVVAMGRICPEKGFHLAIAAAVRACIPLALAGQVFRYETHEQYFRDEILPRLDRFRRFIGPIGMRRKHRLLAAARALLVPSLAPETSSLVAMEALACGTPVIAFPSGALAEIVADGKTGFLVSDEGEMAKRIEDAKGLDPEVCRREARERFSRNRMTQRYLNLYERLAETSQNAMTRPGAGVEPWPLCSGFQLDVTHGTTKREERRGKREEGNGGNP